MDCSEGLEPIQKRHHKHSRKENVFIARQHFRSNSVWDTIVERVAHNVTSCCVYDRPHNVAIAK